MITRFDNNPIVTAEMVKPSRPDFEIMCAFNAGATSYNGKTLLLIRVAERPIPKDGYVATATMNPDTKNIEPMYIKLDDPDLSMDDPRVFSYKGLLYLTSISHLRLAESTDGKNFTIAEQPAMSPDNRYETYGIEDPRITLIDGWYYINYSAISLLGVLTALARTKDFVTFERLGIIFAPDNKDIAIFPEKINGRYYAFHRPSMKQLGSPSMWLASSDNLLDWGHHQHVIGPRPGMWDSERVGCGAAPIRTAKGWLELYHASDENTRYCTGAVLLDLNEPWKVIARSQQPFLFAETACEMSGMMSNVVFHNGLVDNGDGTLTLYYGAADDKVCGAIVK
ncbi:MAG: glycoside hydrolase family 130 protein, partial [bacterium]